MTNKKQTAQEIKIESSNLEEIAKAITVSEEALSNCHFDEASTYIWGLSKFREEVLPQIAAMGSRKNWAYRFACLPTLYGHADFEILLGGVSLEILSQFYDTYGRTVRSTVGQYVDHTLNRAQSALGSIHAE